MVSVQSPPGRRELPYARVLLPPAILLAAAAGAATALVPVATRLAVGVCGAVATALVLATMTGATRRGRRLRRLYDEKERRVAELEGRFAHHDALNRRIADVYLPGAVASLRRGASPDDVMRYYARQDPSYRELDESQRTMLYNLLKIVDFEQDLRDSSQRAFVSVARRIQAIVHQQNKELREMEEDHGRNPEVFDDLLRIDHGTALIGRLADSIGVLGGGRPSRQWPAPVPLYSVLRGAMSRILEYRRINLDSIAKVNIRGISVEPVIHALAELLDNATRYSPPASKVHVNAVDVQTGVAIEIEDAGVSLSEEMRNKAEGMLEDAMQGVDMQDINDTPRLGLAVVGRLCTSFNMQIALRQSAYGGVRAVLIVPTEMLTDGPTSIYAHGIGAGSLPTQTLPPDTDIPQRKPKKRRPTNPMIPAGVSLEDDVPVVTEWTEEGLPQRRSKATVSIADRYVEAYRAQERAKRGEEDMWDVAAKRQEQRAAEAKSEAEKEDRAPGLWVEAFWEGLKKDNPADDPTDFTRNPTKYLHLIEDKDKARTEADDEGDLT
ncbi:ATP-binding protein [Streptomyces sp. NPDC018693]|uniref:ATP-binding protein n=1 Tax=unclassified Streptomyces TaxID=2593676 RepID=UPI0037AF98EC